jgi:uncharacterized membrane protein YfcA
VPLRPNLIATVAGGIAGALLLLWTPNSAFDKVLPWLLLAASLAIIFAPRLGPRLRARMRISLPAILPIQFLLGVYGGYFGGAVGLMMIATWSLLDVADVKALSAPRTLMVTAANAVAVVCFVIAGAVRWPETLLVGAGAIAGGYFGAQIGRRLPAAAVRSGTIVVAVGITIVFFLRAYG